MSETQIIDMQAINGLRELSPDSADEFLRELIEIYLQDTPQRMSELEEALRKGDVTALTRAAHTIKGSSSNFGATQFTKISHEIELQGKSGDLTKTPASLEQLKSAYALLADALAKIAKGA